MIMRLIAALLFLFSVSAFAQTTYTFPNTLAGISATGALTRAANTTAYTGNQIVCASTSTACAAIPITVGRGQNFTGTLLVANLTKSGTSTTNATFTLWFYSRTPTLTSAVDASAFVAPFTADFTSGSVIGSASCLTANSTNAATAQGVYFNCPLSNNGYLPFQTTANGQIIYAVIEVTGAYTPASGEVFTIELAGFDD